MADVSRAAPGLKTELRPHSRLVGLGGFEPPTSPLSGVRSNQLSYRPSSKPMLRNRGPDRAGPNTDLWVKQFVWALPNAGRPLVFKGGDPAAGSPTATLLRLHPSHEPYRGKRPPEG